MSDLVNNLVDLVNGRRHFVNFCLGFSKNMHDHDVSVAKENITNFEVGVKQGNIFGYAK